jgi:hypothetical protein
MKMNILTTYNSTLQVAAAFLIFVVGYLALLLALVVCLLIAEGLHQAFVFARVSFLKSGSNSPQPLLPTPTVVSSSGIFGWTHRFAVSLTGLKDRYFHTLS